MDEAGHLPMRRTEPDDPAGLFYTSSTTGRPKAATLTLRNLMAMTLNYFVDVDAPTRNDSILHAAPMSHGSGLYILPHVSAMAAQIIPESGRFEPDEILELFQRMKGVSLFAAPTMVRRLVEAASAGGDWPGLRSLIYGGGPMYVEDCKAALQAFGPRLVQIYGQGESPMTISVLPKHLHVETGSEDFDRRLASVGYPQSVVEVRVSAGAGQDAAPGEPGEILVRGDTVMQGYWGNEAATHQSIAEGWLSTGDIGSFDATGLLTLRDRLKDVVISGGSNIYPREVEEVLLRHPAVAEVAVLGRPSLEWGEEVVAFIAVNVPQRIDPAELDALCASHIARFKRPKAYIFLPQLPKNNYGKIVKTELRARLRSGDDVPGDAGLAPS